ncbi:MAG TPA: 4a-hydroxytetrahydrobiopterin dehydratase [Microlunatus sp.]|nr:4a-hydroxytetrahydrobiopterin dehydratase [Microlunatus sp.]
MADLLNEDEIARRLESLPAWHATDANGSSAITATFEFTDFVDALDFVNQVGHEAEQVNHHPDIDIRWNRVTLVQSSHSAGGLTAADFDLAQRIAAATGLGSDAGEAEDAAAADDDEDSGDSA